MSFSSWLLIVFSGSLGGLLPWAYIQGYRNGRRAQVRTAERLGTRPRAFILKREEYDYMKKELDRMGFKMLDLAEPLNQLIKTIEARDKLRDEKQASR